MRVQDVGPNLARHLVETTLRRAHQRKLAQNRKLPQQPGLPQGPVEVEPVDVLLGHARRRVLRARKVESLPPDAPLFAQDRPRAERVAAVQWDRVIEDVEDPQAHPTALSRKSSAPSCITFRRNASNMNSVHSGAL